MRVLKRFVSLTRIGRNDAPKPGCNRNGKAVGPSSFPCAFTWALDIRRWAFGVHPFTALKPLKCPSCALSGFPFRLHFRAGQGKILRWAERDFWSGLNRRRGGCWSRVSRAERPCRAAPFVVADAEKAKHEKKWVVCPRKSRMQCLEWLATNQSAYRSWHHNTTGPLASWAGSSGSSNGGSA